MHMEDCNFVWGTLFCMRRVHSSTHRQQSRLTRLWKFPWDSERASLDEAPSVRDRSNQSFEGLPVQVMFINDCCTVLPWITTVHRDWTNWRRRVHSPHTYICSICNEETRVKSIHTRVKSFACGVACETYVPHTTCSGPNGNSDATWSHTGENPIVCNECSVLQNCMSWNITVEQSIRPPRRMSRRNSRINLWWRNDLTIVDSLFSRSNATPYIRQTNQFHLIFNLTLILCNWDEAEWILNNIGHGPSDTPLRPLHDNVYI